MSEPLNDSMEIKAIGCEPLQLKRMHIKDGHTLKVYRETGGYKSLEKALEMTPDRDHSGGQGFGFSRTRRCGFSDRNEMVVCAKGFAEDEIFVCNADESEPGSFKDRYLMERDPHAMIEGMIIAGVRSGLDDRLYLHSRRIQIPDRHHGCRLARMPRGRTAG